ncbi:MAG: nicotinate-nucleotide adenylyltransferase [Clostridium butyricum]|nr:nicotinate-nucleotide adenylyltransferase [Clostridium butyricum]
MKVGIIGGTFDPIHNAHLYIAYEAKEQLNLDKTIFMPTGIQPLKTDKKITPSELRYEMVKKAIKPYNEFEVSDYEINKGGLSYTYMTLEHFKKSYNNEDIELFFITGADCLMNIEKWKEVKKILSLSNLVVFMRGGADREKLLLQKDYIEKKYNASIIFLALKELEISSTDIRNRINEGKKIDFFVPESVKNYIYAKGLYENKEDDSEFLNC